MAGDPLWTARLGHNMGAAVWFFLGWSVVFSWSAATAAQTSQPADESNKAEQNVSYEQAFRDLHAVLGARYPCFELKGIDWPAVGETFFPRVKQVQDDKAFGLLCAQLVAKLEDSHAHLLPGAARLQVEDIPQFIWDPGFACLIDDQDQPVVYHVDPRSPAQRAGVKIGMTVLTVNSRPAADAIEACMARMSRYQGFSSKRNLRYHAARGFVRQPRRGQTAALTLRDPDGVVHRFELPAVLRVRYRPRVIVPIKGISDSANVSWKMLEDNIGYIYVRRIRNELIDSLDQAVLHLHGADGLIIDVRGNGGGGFDGRRALLNFSLNQPEIEPHRPRFHGSIVVLIDAQCISAGEGWASWFIANDRARFFGQATAGASARKTVYTLINGLYQVRFPVKAYRGFLNRPIERRGLEPDAPQMPRAIDLANGRDTVLEAARDYLLETNASANDGKRHAIHPETVDSP